MFTKKTYLLLFCLFRLIRRHHLGDEFSDIGGVVDTGTQQMLQLMQEHLGVQVNRMRDMDEPVGCLRQALFAHQLLLIELLARTQARVLNPNVYVGLEARQAYQVAGQGVNLHRLTHVQDKDLAASRIGGRLQDQRDRLGYRHEVTDDVRVRDRHGASLRYLSLEQWYHRTIRAQDVAKADSHKLRSGGIRRKLDVALLQTMMGVGMREQGQLSGTDHTIHRLNDHLADSLGGAHDVRGVDRLVGGDEQEASAAVGEGGVGRLVGAQDVVLDGLAGRVLHQRDMLVGGGVEDQLGLVALEDVLDASGVADGADEHREIEVGMMAEQLLLDVVGVVLVDVEDDEASGMVGGDLSAEFGADGAAAAGDEDGASVEVVEDLVVVDDDGVASEEVLDLDVLHAGEADFAVGELIDAGEGLDGAAGLVADAEDGTSLGGGGRRDGDKDLLDAEGLDGDGDEVAAADDGDVVDAAVPFVVVVVDDALEDDVASVGGGEVAEDEASGGAGADEEGVFAGAVSGEDGTCEDEAEEAPGEARSDEEGKLGEAAEDVVEERHPVSEGKDGQGMDGKGTGPGDEAAEKLAVAGETPDAVVEAGGDADGGRGERDIGSHLAENLKIGRGDGVEGGVKAEPECQEVGQLDGENVDQAED